MGRRGFEERQFTCAICGERFTALCGPVVPAVVVCTHCGLRYSPSQRQSLIRARQAEPRNRP